MRMCVPIVIVIHLQLQPQASVGTRLLTATSRGIQNQKVTAQWFLFCFLLVIYIFSVDFGGLSVGTTRVCRV